jgi:hypothetical protein
MPVEAETIPAAAADTPSKKKPAQSSGRAALAKVTLLDGSVLDVTIDVINFRLSNIKYFL